MGLQTWLRLRQAYDDILAMLPQDEGKQREGFIRDISFPWVWKMRMCGNLQTYLKGIADYSGVIPPIAVTGVFDEATRDAVAALQAQNDLPPTGNVGPATWNLIRRLYNAR